MLKILIKKQLSELGSSYFYNRKKGKMRSKGGIFGMSALYLFIWFSCAFAFYGMFMLFTPLLETELSWLYYSFATILSLAVGIFANSLYTAHCLYSAKDNDILLSMPVKPGYILLSRLLNVAILATVFSSMILVPISVNIWLHSKFNPVVILGTLVSFIVNTVLIIAFSCIFGFLISLISSRFKRKNYATVILTLAFLVVYYYLQFNLTNIIKSILSISNEIAADMKKIAYPIYLISKASVGDIPAMLLSLLCAAVIAIVLYLILSATFIGVATTLVGSAKGKRKNNINKVSGINSALLKKEFGKFFNTPIYLLNSGLGFVVFIAAGIVILIKKDFIYSAISQIPALSNVLPFVVVAAVSLICSMDNLAAPSISLEGKSIWIPQSLPVPGCLVLHAKRKMDVLFNLPPAVFVSICFCIALRFDVYTSFMVALCCAAFSLLHASSGVWLGLKFPILDWTNETIPVKQGTAVVLGIFVGWIFSGLIFVVGYFFVQYIKCINTFSLLVIFFAIIYLLNAVFMRWITKNGSKIFNYL